MFRYFFTILLLLVSVGVPIVLSGMEAKVPIAQNNDAPVELTEEEAYFVAREPLTDIEGHWAENSIENLYHSGVVKGYGDGTFGPNDPVTRTQYLTITLRAFGHDEAEDNWADYAYSIGVISDLELWKNNGDDHVSRAEGLKILIELVGINKGTSLSPNFLDVDIVNDWFAPYAAFALAQGISTGDSEGNFNGNADITRAETCTLTLRMMERLPSSESGE